MGLIGLAVEEIRLLSLRAFFSWPVMIERWMRGAKRSGWHELLQLTSVNYCVHVSQEQHRPDLQDVNGARWGLGCGEGQPFPRCSRLLVGIESKYHG